MRTGFLRSLLAAIAMAVCAQDVTFKQSVKMVEVYATVFDRGGHPVDGLTREQFQIIDGGKTQEIRVFEPDTEAISCALLLDTTGSMKAVLPEVMNGVRTLIQALRRGDSASVYAFSEQLMEIQENTTDKALLSRALVRLRASGRTALFDSVSELALEQEKLPGKKAIVLLTDGGDNASVLNRDSAVRRARASGIPIFAIAEGDALNDPGSEHLLQELSGSTGGRLYRAKSSKDLRAIFADITLNLRSAYLLAFQAPEERGDASWHELQVLVKDQEQPLRIRARTGYPAD